MTLAQTTLGRLKACRKSAGGRSAGRLSRSCVPILSARGNQLVARTPVFDPRLGMNAKGVPSFSPGLRDSATLGTPPLGLNPERVASVPHSAIVSPVSKPAGHGQTKVLGQAQSSPIKVNQGQSSRIFSKTTAGVGTARPHESNRDDLATSRRHPARESSRIFANPGGNDSSQMRGPRTSIVIRHSCLGIDSSFAIRHSSFFAPLCAFALKTDAAEPASTPRHFSPRECGSGVNS